MFFYFLKIIFDISTSKRSKKYKPHSILVKKKIEIFQKAGSTAVPNGHLSSSLEDLYLEEFIKLKLNKITKTIEHQIFGGYLIRKSCTYKEEKILM